MFFGGEEKKLIHNFKTSALKLGNYSNFSKYNYLSKEKEASLQ